MVLVNCSSCENKTNTNDIVHEKSKNNKHTIQGTA